MRSHSADIVSLVAGTLFMLVAITGMTGFTWSWGLEARWLLPAALVGLGLIGLASVLSRRDRSDSGE